MIPKEHGIGWIFNEVQELEFGGYWFSETKDRVSAGSPSPNKKI